MATHFGIGADQVACGRNNHNLVSVRTPDRVTCKTCRSTEAHRAAVIAEESKATVGRQIIAGVRAAAQHLNRRQHGLSWKDAWEQRLTILGPGNRLPRGFKLQPVTKLFRIMQDEMPLTITTELQSENV